MISEDLATLLLKWKQEQSEELKSAGITIDENQFIFTYNDRHGNINISVHTDYLNYRMKSIEHRHSELKHASPHKLRHTYSTLAREGGATMAQISQALTHSDIKTTEIYVNTPNVVDLATHQKFEERLD
ncbi:hypothetical protein RD055328_01520 [Companilactobacillus sp. RD055328]|nr:hypothetical protein RD055328_01520 [Companilactobacillus sp. RD055328]